MTTIKSSIGIGCLPRRYVLTAMGCLAIFNAYTMRVCLNVAITEMAEARKTGGPSYHDPDSCPDPAAASNSSSAHTAKKLEFDWDEPTQGLILSAFYWGYVLTHIPGGILADRIGGKMLLLGGILCTSFFTLLTPLAARAGGASWVIAVRFLEGLGEGTTFPAANVLLANWAPPQERSKMGSVVFSGNLIGSVIGTAGSGLIINWMNNEWSGVFYVFGVVGVIWCIAFWFMCYSYPDQDPSISEQERTYIVSSIKAAAIKRPDSIPWKAIACSLPLWGLVFGQLGHDWVLFTMGTDLPKYMKSVLKYNVKENGLLSSLPNLAMFLVAVVCGWLSDWLITTGRISITNHRKIFTTAASLLPGLGLIGASYAGCDRALVVTLFTVGMACMGPFYSSLKVNALDLSPNYAGLLMAIVNGLGAISGIISPYLVGLLIPNSALAEWRVVFWVTLGMSIATNIIYIFTASGKVQPWNSLESLNSPTAEKQRRKIEKEPEK